MDFEKLNTRATQELKKILSKQDNIEFTSEQKTGFYLETKFGRFWFQCETVDMK